MVKWNCIGVILSLLTVSCSSKTDSTTKTEESESVSTENIYQKEDASIFGTVIHLDEVTAIKELSEAGVLKCDTVMIEDGDFKGAVIEFASVRFGMNKGFVL